MCSRGGNRGAMARKKTPSFVLELPLVVEADQAKRLCAHLEAARCLYNALLGEALKRMRRMCRDSAWQAARAIPRSHKQERTVAFSQVRKEYCFSEYGMHDYAKEARCSWIAEHLDSTMAQALATRAYQAVNRVCLGLAKNVRFRSRGRGLDSVEGKRNNTGMRFVLEEGEQGNRYVVQLVLEGKPYQKSKNQPGNQRIGLDIGPSSLAIFPREGTVQLKMFCEDLQPDIGKKRRLQRKLERQRRANNPNNYDERGRIKPQDRQRLLWKESRGYKFTRRQLANQERKLAAHRKSLHGKLVNEIVRVGNHLQIEKTSYQGWQKQFGKSVGLRAPGMFVEHLKRIVAKTGGTLSEVGTSHTKLSQYCHGCKTYVKKPLSQRWHQCPCGIGPIQRDLYSAFLLAYLDPAETIPSIALKDWEGAEPRLKAVMESLQQRAKEGQSLPRSFGIPEARARRPKSLVPNQQELVFLYRRGRLEALGLGQEPPCSSAGEVSVS
jgi:hypothetical protein